MKKKTITKDISSHQIIFYLFKSAHFCMSTYSPVGDVLNFKITQNWIAWHISHDKNSLKNYNLILFYTVIFKCRYDFRTVFLVFKNLLLCTVNFSSTASQRPLSHQGGILHTANDRWQWFQTRVTRGACH